MDGFFRRCTALLRLALFDTSIDSGEAANNMIHIEVITQRYQLSVEQYHNLDETSHQILIDNLPLLEVETLQRVVTWLFHEALKQGNWPLFSVLITHRSVACLSTAGHLAVRNDDIKALELLYDCGWPLLSEHLTRALRRSQWTIAKQLVGYGATVEESHLVIIVSKLAASPRDNRGPLELLTLCWRHDLDYSVVLPAAFTQPGLLTELIDRLERSAYHLHPTQYHQLFHHVWMAPRPEPLADILADHFERQLPLDAVGIYQRLWQQALSAVLVRPESVLIWLMTRPKARSNWRVALLTLRYERLDLTAAILSGVGCVNSSAAAATLAKVLVTTSGDPVELLGLVIPLLVENWETLITLALEHQNYDCYTRLITCRGPLEQVPPPAFQESARVRLVTITAEALESTLTGWSWSKATLETWLSAVIGLQRQDLLRVLLEYLSTRSHSSPRLSNVSNLAERTGNYLAMAMVDTVDTAGGAGSAAETMGKAT
jgi:hypothetical protein